MRADRLLAILLLLQRHQKLPAAELAERLEVSTRTVYRDIEALSAAGVPVYAERGRHGGVTLIPGYRTDLTGLTAGEAQALFLFSGKGPVDQLGLGDDLRQAIRKLLAAVPDTQRDEVERISGRIVVDPQSWRRAEEAIPHLSALQDAVLADRRVRIFYPSRTAGMVRTYELDPYGLVAKAGVWYVLAGTSDGVRTFRVSRIRALVPLDETFTRPDDLDVERLWEEKGQAFDRKRLADACDVVARVEQRVVELVRRSAAAFLTDGVRPPTGTDPDRRFVAHFTFGNVEHATAVLLPYADAVEVVGPAEVRAALRAKAAAVVAVYAAATSP